MIVYRTDAPIHIAPIVGRGLAPAEQVRYAICCVKRKYV